MANEIKQAINALMQLVIYYSVEEELHISIENSLNRMREEELI